MPQSLAKIWLHIVFSTKERRRLLQNEQLRDEMFRMLSYEVERSGCVSAGVGGVGGYSDHVHQLVGLSRTVTVADLVKKLKTKTSKWAKNADRGVANFQWQSGYGVFSVSQSQCEAVNTYIRNQKANHSKGLSFQEEFRLLCDKHSIEMDERYVWD